MRFKHFLLTAALLCFSLTCSPTTYKHGINWLPYPKWDKKPLLVVWDKKEWGDKSYVIRAAMAEYPCNLFEEYDPLKHGIRDPDVVVRKNYERGTVCGKYRPPSNGGAAAGWAYRCNRHTAVILANAKSVAAYDDIQVYLLMLHEFGHVAGLGHSQQYKTSYEGEVSIMDPYVIGHAKRPVFGLSLPVLKEEDKEALKRRYCNGT